MNAFDRNLGRHLQESLPEAPGIYRFYDRTGELIYVGKAKNLRRRLGQYRNARRRKKHAKMRKIVAEATRLEFETTGDELAALCLENEWIQGHRPKWNVAGAFFFLYPMIGIRVEDGIVHFCYTTLPERFPEFRFHGTFRSRARTRDGFFALMELLRLVGHPISRRKSAPGKSGGEAPPPRGSTYVYAFRQIPPEWSARLDSFFRGESFGAVEELALLLLERPSAVARRAETQERLRTIRGFWRHEIRTLREARERAHWTSYPVPQRERDALFILARAPIASAARGSGHSPHI